MTKADFNKIAEIYEPILATMILAHERQFGKKPISLSIPSPIFEFCDVKITFHQAPQYFSCDAENCLHHYFDYKEEK